MKRFKHEKSNSPGRRSDQCLLNNCHHAQPERKLPVLPREQAIRADDNNREQKAKDKGQRMAKMTVAYLGEKKWET